MASMSLLGFIGHLAGVDHRLHTHGIKAMEWVGEIVEKEAKNELGTYQASAGPFAGWAELADSTKSDRVSKGFTENDPGLRTGEMRESIRHVADDHEVVIGSDDDKMVWFEVGTAKQPPRSVLGVAVIHKEKEIQHHLGGSVVSALIGHDVFGGSIPISGG